VNEQTRAALAAEAKQEVMKIAALTDRGQLTKVQGMYSHHRGRVAALVDTLSALAPAPPGEAAELVGGEWEVLYCSQQLFRASPFFMAIEEAYNDTAKSELFFRLHELQTHSFGLSTVGRVYQRIDLDKGIMESEFDTVIFRETVVPLVGFWKLLPTFGGRICSTARDVSLSPTGTLSLTLDTTDLRPAPGLALMPLLGKAVAGLDPFPTAAVWELLPWNRGKPTASSEVVYVDGEMRVMRSGDVLTVYVRPTPE